MGDLTTHTLHRGDGRVGLRSLGDESVDLIVTDPPFGIAHDSNRAGSEWAGEIVGDAEADTSWLCDASRVLRSGCALYLFTRWDVEHEWMTAVRAAGLTVKQSIVWDRGTHGTGDLRGTYGPSHERVIYATKGRHILRSPRVDDVWRVGAICSREWRWHPHEKPVGLLAIPVEKSSAPGGLVVDPFAGSGSTLLAARSLGRSALGWEIDPQWHAWATQRLAGAPRRDPEGLGLERQPLLFGGAR